MCSIDYKTANWVLFASHPALPTFSTGKWYSFACICICVTLPLYHFPTSTHTPYFPQIDIPRPLTLHPHVISVLHVIYVFLSKSSVNCSLFYAANSSQVIVLLGCLNPEFHWLHVHCGTAQPQLCSMLPCLSTPTGCVLSATHATWSRPGPSQVSQVFGDGVGLVHFMQGDVSSAVSGNVGPLCCGCPGCAIGHVLYLPAPALVWTPKGLPAMGQVEKTYPVPGWLSEKVFPWARGDAGWQ